MVIDLQLEAVAAAEGCGKCDCREDSWRQLIAYRQQKCAKWQRRGVESQILVMLGLPGLVAFLTQLAISGREWLAARLLASLAGPLKTCCCFWWSRGGALFCCQSDYGKRSLEIDGLDAETGRRRRDRS